MSGNYYIVLFLELFEVLKLKCGLQKSEKKKEV